MDKEFGKLTTEQFRQLVRKLPEYRQGDHDFRVAAAGITRERLDQLFPAGAHWYYLYELPFAQHLGLVFLCLDGGFEILESFKYEQDPQQAILSGKRLERLDFDPDAHQGGYLGMFDKHLFIQVCVALQRTMLSIMLFQRSISGLIEEVREGNHDSLFNAIRVDRSCVACPSIADHIARAELTGDKRFMLRLRNALKGPQAKHWESYRDLRYSLFVLREMGFKSLSDDQLEELLVRQLKVYPDRAEARKNLRAQYQASKKISTF